MDDLAALPIIQNALREDLGWGDVTVQNLINSTWQSELVIVLKQDGVVAGLDIARLTFQSLDANIVWKNLVSEGDWLMAGTLLARVQGNAQALLKAERVALNFLQRLSGVATLTHKFVQAAKQGNPHCRIVDTRKTTPGLRMFEKYAVVVGGGHNHRYHLSDAVLIKDNHLAILTQAGLSWAEEIKKLRSRLPHTLKIEAEVDHLEQIPAMLAAGVDILLLDNMSLDDLRQAVKMIQGRVITEASGGVRLENVAQIAACGVDLISVGAVTHSAPALDISLDYLTQS